MLRERSSAYYQELFRFVSSHATVQHTLGLHLHVHSNSALYSYNSASTECNSILQTQHHEPTHPTNKDGVSNPQRYINIPHHNIPSHLNQAPRTLHRRQSRLDHRRLLRSRSRIRPTLRALRLHFTRHNRTAFAHSRLGPKNPPRITSQCKSPDAPMRRHRPLRHAHRLYQDARSFW
jgi:hypothetical protein